MVVPPPLLRPDTLKSIDTLIRADFIAYRETCFNWLLAATGLVVAGLVFEGPELWHEISSITRHWRFRRRFHFSLPEDHTPNWAKLLAFVGWLLIVIGVAGEYVADSFVSRADGYVQTFDEILLTETQNRTALASERASAAYERASENEKETAATLKQAEQERADAAKSLAAAGTARKDAEGFSVQIAQANERAAQAEKQAADANARAAKDELELVKIKQWRTLTPKQKQEMGAALSVYAGQNFAFLVFGDPESLSFLFDIRDALKIAKWNRVATPPGLGGDIGYNVDGINVPSVNEIGQDVFVSTDDTAAQPAAVALAGAISKADIPCPAHLSYWLKQQGAKTIVIRVGKKQP